MSADLRAIAEAATPGPWQADPGPDYDPTDWVVFAPNSAWVANLNEPQPEGWTWNGGTSGQRSSVAEGLEANAAHIAAWSPDRAVAALDVIEAAQEVIAPFPGLHGASAKWLGAVMDRDQRACWQAGNELAIAATQVVAMVEKLQAECVALRAALDRWDALR